MFYDVFSKSLSKRPVKHMLFEQPLGGPLVKHLLFDRFSRSHLGPPLEPSCFTMCSQGRLQTDPRKRMLFEQSFCPPPGPLCFTMRSCLSSLNSRVLHVWGLAGGYYSGPIEKGRRHYPRWQTRGRGNFDIYKGCAHAADRCCKDPLGT